MTVWQAWRRALDRLMLYLPLLAMALLAMASWWAVRNMPSVWPEPVPRAVRQEPDYHLESFTTEVFDAGGRRIRQVSGQRARHYPGTDELHIDDIRLTTVTAQGAELVVTARLGISSGDGERVTLVGQVHVLRPAFGQTPRIEMWADKLLALPKQERLLSDLPVEILRDQDRFQANGLDFDTRSGQYQLSGRVRGLLSPRKP